MENQGFEEEQLPRRETTSASFEIAFFPEDNTSTDGHVYEDILPQVETVSKSVQISDNQNQHDPKNSNIQEEHNPDLSNTKTKSFDEKNIGFQRNLTLPFRRGIGQDSSRISSSVRERNKKEIEEEKTKAWNIVDDSFSREIVAKVQSTPLHGENRQNRRRRKKDCKHCRSKAALSTDPKEYEIDEREVENILRKNQENDRDTSADFHGFSRSNDFTIPIAKSVFTISENVEEQSSPNREICSGVETEMTEGRSTVAIVADKNRTGMRVNSIYSQDRWYAKEAPIFVTDVKEQSPFQRAYSLPVRSQTPSSQNRINLRRSVRGEPPPHPARLRKHRHGWTLHLARPLEASGCTRSFILLSIALLLLLGIGAFALYIAFEPQKLQILQQYLRSPTNGSSSSTKEHTLATRTLLPIADNEQNDSVLSDWIVSPSSVENSSLTTSVILNDNSDNLSAVNESSSNLVTEEEVTGSIDVNSTRYCDDCLKEEVCVALVDEEVPICRIPLDSADPTGCAGFCLINKQKCHRLDVDAFRCVEVEHYCLDDEWTCLNTLCIPFDKRCDGHMNCYDHSDEYNCVCELETHFQCGNETSCLPLEKKCDGRIDCWDAADEINCTLACPSENEFTCSNGQCISKARFCDGLSDCLDESDEPHGCQGRCNKHEFACQNSRCITKGMKCNGVDDCGDGTDERYCKDRSF